jgi:ParB family chromosome partitioning protein
MPTTYPTKPIADITINKRHRKDLGDVEALAASIKEVGLLHPVVINPDGTRRHPDRRGTSHRGMSVARLDRSARACR